jgi:hypothetical protein
MKSEKIVPDAGKDLNQVKRARVTAFVLASLVIVSLVFLVFAFIQKNESDVLRKKLAETQVELENCQSGR